MGKSDAAEVMDGESPLDRETECRDGEIGPSSSSHDQKEKGENEDGTHS
jgi:hypothetical protein